MIELLSDAAVGQPSRLWSIGEVLIDLLDRYQLGPSSESDAGVGLYDPPRRNTLPGSQRAIGLPPIAPVGDDSIARVAHDESDCCLSW